MRARHSFAISIELSSSWRPDQPGWTVLRRQRHLPPPFKALPTDPDPLITISSWGRTTSSSTEVAHTLRHHLIATYTVRDRPQPKVCAMRCHLRYLLRSKTFSAGPARKARQRSLSLNRCCDAHGCRGRKLPRLRRTWRAPTSARLKVNCWPPQPFTKQRSTN